MRYRHLCTELHEMNPVLHDLYPSVSTASYRRRELLYESLYSVYPVSYLQGGLRLLCEELIRISLKKHQS